MSLRIYNSKATTPLHSLNNMSHCFPSISPVNLDWGRTIHHQFWGRASIGVVKGLTDLSRNLLDSEASVGISMSIFMSMSLLSGLSGSLSLQHSLYGVLASVYVPTCLCVPVGFLSRGALFLSHFVIIPLARVVADTKKTNI